MALPSIIFAVTQSPCRLGLEVNRLFSHATDQTATRLCVIPEPLYVYAK
jgi:hypothetical protein